ncbi:uncharacterized protein LOC120754407 isoform X2 [Hirundo rustica]|uniref:uncharacterized protein LOC120754407 isoform X2 n=1 Tax=Hirundo rustica TaxID=43150 RepID=UPI001A94C194|nr:uncharacterized protein LOC120754407 isoform X2 [Hirundo rustica]
MGERGKRFLGSSGLKLFLSLAVAGHAWISAAALLVCMTGGFQGCDGQHCSLERLSGGAQGCNGLPGSSSASVPGRSCPALSSSPSFPGQLIRAVLEGEILVVAVSCLPRLANAAVVVGVWPWGSWGQYPGVSAVIPEVEERLGMRRRDLEPPFSQNDTSAESSCSESEHNLVFSTSPTRMCQRGGPRSSRGPGSESSSKWCWRVSVSPCLVFQVLQGFGPTAGSHWTLDEH